MRPFFKIVSAPLVFLTIVITSGCEESKLFSNQFGSLPADKVLEVSIKILKDTNYTLYSIRQKDSILTFVEELNSAKYDGPWKGIKWDKIILKLKDTTLILNTNGKVFGLKASGGFYKFPDTYKTIWTSK